MKGIIISCKSTIYSALQKIQDSSGSSLIVVNSKNKLIGTLSDGDVRRAILKGKKLTDQVKEICRKKCFFAFKSSKDLASLNNLCKKENVELIPIIDEKKKVVDYFLSKNFNNFNLTEEDKKLEVVIMAGGEGSRLRPLTNIVPKPLIPLQDKTVLEKIIEKFYDQGFKKFILSINYKSNIIKSFLKNLKPKFSYEFIEEKKKLGTAGSLYFLKNKKRNNFFIINCDTIIDIDYLKLLDFHKSNKNDLTLVVSAKKFLVPYGSCKIKKNGELLQLDEKPEHHHLVNTGLYLINRQLFNLIKKNYYLNFDDFIRIIKRKRKKIGLFPISENSWSDVGKWDEYKKFLEKL